MRRFAAAAVCSLTVVSACPGTRAADAPAVRAIDAACASRSHATAGAAASTFVAIYDGSAGDGVWRRADAASLRRIAHDPNIYSEIAHVRTAGGRVAVVEIASNSLDFGAHTTYCFRASGTLARAAETSSGTTNEDRELYYLDDRGRVIARSSHLGLLGPRANATPSPDVKPAKVELFLAVGALPFARLLPRR